MERFSYDHHPVVYIALFVYAHISHNALAKFVNEVSHKLFDFLFLSLVQIDMEQVRAVSGVATQGYMIDIYVTSYSLNYSTDGRTWQSYKEKGPKSGTKVRHSTQ